VTELLLADRSPCLRLLVLKNCLGLPNTHPEVRELEAVKEKDPIASVLLKSQLEDGSWRDASRPAGPRIVSTSMGLSRLSFLGFKAECPAVKKGAAFLFSLQRADGSWPVPGKTEDGERHSMIPLQTALPLAGLSRAGFADDLRAERAYEWLLNKRLEDGAWPTGTASGVHRYVGGYRRLPHSRWGCRTNTTAALICLAHHPGRRTSPEARAALDHLAARETRDRANLGFETARILGFEPLRGYVTFHAAFDPALVLDLCARIGASEDDERITGLTGFIRSSAGPTGLWEYSANPLASRWVSYSILNSLAVIKGNSRARDGWTGSQPRTPFRAYPRGKRRY
jgi:hypothetical protein